MGMMVMALSRRKDRHQLFVQNGGGRPGERKRERVEIGSRGIGSVGGARRLARDVAIRTRGEWNQLKLEITVGGMGAGNQNGQRNKGAGDGLVEAQCGSGSADADADAVAAGARQLGRVLLGAGRRRQGRLAG